MKFNKAVVGLAEGKLYKTGESYMDIVICMANNKLMFTAAGNLAQINKHNLKPGSNEQGFIDLAGSGFVKDIFNEKYDFEEYHPNPVLYFADLKRGDNFTKPHDPTAVKVKISDDEYVFTGMFTKSLLIHKINASQLPHYEVIKKV